MGRFLEIARDTEHRNTEHSMPTLPPPMPERTSLSSLASAALAVLISPLKPVEVAAPPFDALASAVLQILVREDRPVPHPEIVRRMIAAGHDKTAAKQAIARCQKRRWIEHNFETGYVLS